MRWLRLCLALALGCGSTVNRESTIPEAGRARWSACRSAVERYCRDRNNGDPMGSSQCESSTASEYAALATDPARASFLAGRGCAALPPP